MKTYKKLYVVVLLTTKSQESLFYRTKLNSDKIVQLYLNPPTTPPQGTSATLASF